jgi:PhnB protein
METFPLAHPRCGPVAVGLATGLQSYSATMPNPPPGYPRVSPYLLYENAAAAVEYLKKSFGFELRLSQTGGAGRTHNELLLGDDGLVMLGQAGEGFSSPRTLGSFPPSMIHVYVDDVEALHAREKDAGAEATDLELSPVGDRRFTATDPEGQLWVFAQRVAPADN